MFCSLRYMLPHELQVRSRTADWHPSNSTADRALSARAVLLLLLLLLWVVGLEVIPLECRFGTSQDLARVQDGICTAARHSSGSGGAGGGSVTVVTA